MNGSLPFDQDILKERIRQKYNNGQLPGQQGRPQLYQMGRFWSPEDILAEVEAGTSAGIQFMQAEQNWIQESAKHGR